MSLLSRGWEVHKLGGTSLGTPECYTKVKDVVQLAQNSLPSESFGVIVSASAGVTDFLLKCTALAKTRDDSYISELKVLSNKIHALGSSLLSGVSLSTYESVLVQDFQAVSDILKAAWLTNFCSPEMEELVVGFGELWSAQLLNLVLQSQGYKSTWLDARKVLYVSKGEVGPIVDWEKSGKTLNSWIDSNLNGTEPISIVVITGFIASTLDGLATTLKRNGSDFSASIFSALLKAKKMTIWKEVDGIFSADPRKVPEAVHLKEISYAEAMELAYFGAKILHPHTMAPAIEHSIPITLKNVFHPERSGTVIKQSVQDVRVERQVVRGFSAIPRVALVNVEGTGMMGVPGVASRIFGSLKEIGVSVILISQASSEHSICFAVPDDQGTLAQAHIHKAFYMEINHYRQIQRVDVLSNCEILAAVGDQMAHTPGLAAKLLSALGNRDINILAIAQGSSERNISVVIRGVDSTRALQAAHSAFFRPYDPLVLSVGIIGPGLVGGTLLEQLKKAKFIPKNVSKFVFRVRGVCNSKRMILGSNYESDVIPLHNWKEELEVKGVSYDGDMDRFVEAIQSGYPRHAIIVDCTSSEQIAKQYPRWIERGVHIVAPNKRAFSGPLELYHDIKKAMQMSGRHCLYETTVGAGLPILHMLQELQATGDRVVRIEGIFSGTLSFIFNTFSSKESRNSYTPFSEVVLEAKKRGYTEPDPRDDLNGMDFARKVLILARECGADLVMTDLKIDSLVDANDVNCPVEEFLGKRLHLQDEKWKKEAEDALSKGFVLRYVGVVNIQPDPDNNKKTTVVSVGIQKYPFSHPFASLKGCDNVIAIQSDRYSDRQPMIVQGPGAGAEVTAGGIFGDMFRIANYVS